MALVTKIGQTASTIQASAFTMDMNSNTKQTTTLAGGATTITLTRNFLVLTGDGAGNTVATITGGVTGQILTIIFTDAKVTLTDTGTGAANTLDLSAAWTGSAGDVMQLIFDSTSWYEICRSVN